MKNNFINVGFEFTASAKAKSKPKKLIIAEDGFQIRKNYNAKDYSYDDSIAKKKWINDRFNSDECGCEVSTPIVTNKQDVTRYFNEFESWVKYNNLTIKQHDAKCGGGGCHIHMNLSNLDDKLKKKLLRNMAILLTNYPQLNWGFNNINDNITANSLLTEFKESVNFGFKNPPVMASCFLTDNTTERYFSDNKFPRFLGYRIKKSSPFHKFSDDKRPINAFLCSPLKADLKKGFALRYDSSYKSVELRGFIMPENLTQHLLHYDVAVAIYNYCLDLANKGWKLKLNYKSNDEYARLTLHESLCRFNEILFILKIDKRRTTSQVENIKTRYEWNKKYELGDDKNGCYLL